MLQSKDPAKALLEDPPVVAIHYQKKEHTPEQHEFLINELPTNRYVLEHTVSLPPTAEPNDAIVNQFMNHPTSQKVLNAILETINIVPSSVLVGGAAVAVGAAVAAPGPVSISAAVSAVVPVSWKSASSFLKPAKSPNLLLVDEGHNISSSYLLCVSHFSPTVAPTYSLTERTSMMIAKVLEAMSNSQTGRLLSESSNQQKIPPDPHANDQFFGEDKFDNDVYKTAVKLLTFHPKCLTWVHMVILAHVINEEHPLYGLFRRQWSYWFACTFFYCAQIIDHRLQKLEGEVEPDNRDSDDMFMLFHLFQAKLAGCWKGVQIHGVKLVLLNHIIMQFDNELAKLTAEVFLYSFNYYHLLNS